MIATHNLPKQLTPFVGRKTEVQEISDLLCENDCRLVSLIGAGGMGKTRLAIEIAEQKLSNFSDGIYFVGLQAIASAKHIASVIGTALNFEFYDDEEYLKEQLLNYLTEKEILFIIDNFEQVLEGAEFLVDILICAPKTKIIVTSREALKLQQEWVRPISGMPFPEKINDNAIDNYSALQLFIERAQQFSSHFDVESELPHIIRICQLVGGMPLGIELAAAWLTTLSCAEIANEIAKNLEILTAQVRDISQRHQSIAVIFDATWQMLSADEQTVFMRLSVFRDKPTRHAIQSITHAGLLTLSALADKALLIPTENGRYQIHELLRQYAHAKLIHSDELDTVKNAHSEYYLRFMKDAKQDILGRRQVEAIDEIARDFENIRLAWEWAVEQMNYAGIGAAVETLSTYLHFRSVWKQESYLLTLAQEKFAPQDNQDPHPVWGMVIARNYLNSDDRIATLQKSLEIAQKNNDKDEIGLSLFLMGLSYSYIQETHESNRYFEASMPYFEAVGNHYHWSAAYGYVAMNYRFIGDYKKGIEYNEIHLKMSLASGDIDGQIVANTEFSNTLFILGDLVEGAHYRQEAIALAERFGKRWHIIWLKWELATYYILGKQGDLKEAKRIVNEDTMISKGIHVKGGWESPAFPNSLFASLEGNYEEAYQLIEKLHQTRSHAAWYAIYSWALLIVASEHEDYDTVEQYNKDILVSFWELRVLPFLFVGITFSAILRAYRDHNPQYATKLLALASTHPSSLSGWLDIWDFISTMKQDLENELGTVEYQAQWQQGQSLDWEVVVGDLVAEYQDNNDDVIVVVENNTIPEHVISANATLFEPLSERELEVLIKIGQGYTNREIAELLYVGVSTIKKHITHIYSKLTVDNRTQALLRAQELKLIP
ncbi:MAG: hypothetical protein Phog2KO_07250 [Phototrophicaceae bacterium]